MPSNATYSYRDSFTSAGTPFSRSRSVTIDNTTWSGAFGNVAEISTVLQFTAPVGTSFEQIWDIAGTALGGGDAFGATGLYDFVLVINRSSTDTLTLRFDDSGGSNHAYLDIPPGGRFMWYGSSVILTSLSGTGLFGSLSAKFGSATDTVELVAFSVNAAYS